MVVFIVLHYMAFEMTDECVRTLKSTFPQQKFHIVIVDNGSSNNSGLMLKEQYNDDHNVSVILTKKNLGFARGNNVGYQYVRAMDNVDFAVIINNDVLIRDRNFIKRIYSIYKETPFEVLGPDIYASKANIHQSPMRLTGYTKEEVKKIHDQHAFWLAIYPLYYGWTNAIERFKAIVKKMIRWKGRDVNNPYAAIDKIDNPVLHGACIIFSKDYIKKEKNAFNPNTFLYMEEDILHAMCEKKGYKMLYDSSIKVEHLEDVSTNYMYRTDYKKQKMKFKNLIKSSEVLLDVMEDENENSNN